MARAIFDRRGVVQNLFQKKHVRYALLEIKNHSLIGGRLSICCTCCVSA